MNSKDRPSMYPLFFRLPPENIVFLKFTLESHEGIAMLRTLNAEAGLVVVLGMTETSEILNAIISDISGEIGLERIERPADFPNEDNEDLLIEYLLQ